MKKKLSVLAVILVLIITTLSLVACNPYDDWNPNLPSGDTKAPVVSNGGYFVQQGKYAYFVNGCGNEKGDNTFGTPKKQSIMRAEIKNGVVDSKTARVVVPQIIYNEDKQGGFSIFGDWIYYLTPNNELDKDKKPNTTMSNCMRTKTNGSITQRIATFNQRNIKVMFTKSRVYFVQGTDIKYYDFSGMNTTKNIDDGKGVVGGTLVKDATEIIWDYDCDYIFYDKAADEKDAYKGYNSLCAISKDGSVKETLITQDTYVTDKEGYNKNWVDFKKDVFKIKLIQATQHSDEEIALYYVKTPVGNAQSTLGLFVNTYNPKTNTFDIKNEKQLSFSTPSTIYSLGYDAGCIAGTENGFYLLKDDLKNKTPEEIKTLKKTKVLASGNTILTVDQENQVIYYTPQGFASVWKISYKLDADNTVKGNAQLAMNEKAKDWLLPEIVTVTDAEGNVSINYYFFAVDDNNYLHVANIKNFNPQDEPYVDNDTNGEFNEGDIDANGDGVLTKKDESQLVGERTKADQDAYEEAHKDKDKDKDKE